MDQKNYKTEVACLYLFLYSLFKYSKSSAMITVIAEVGIKVEGHRGGIREGDGIMGWHNL